jgi:DNA-binding LacI/PurR family transcriptional regulator
VFRRRHVLVLSEVAVTGYRHDQSVLSPETATLRYPGKALGEAPARLLLRRLEGREASGALDVVLALAYMNGSAS